MANGLGLNQHHIAGGDTYLSANSGDVSLADGVVTQLLNFRSPNAISYMSFEIFIPSRLLVAGDRLTIKWYQDAETTQKYDWLQVSTGGREGNMPIVMNKTIEANTPVIVEVKFDATGFTPAVDGCCNMSGRVY